MKGRLRHRSDRTGRPRWVAPRRRLRPCLGPCDVTWHAVDAWLARKPGVEQKGAYEALCALAPRAQFCGRTATGEELFAMDGVCLVVWRPARRRPMVLTVLAAEDR